MKFLIVGLGNIGPDYENTRHNVGFEILNELAEGFSGHWETKKLGEVCKLKYGGKIYILLKPSTFMNRSGKAVNYWMLKEKVLNENVLIVVDDLNLEFGQIRLRGKGSDGGHNGLKSVQNYLGAKYARLRVGIGNKFGKGHQVDYVLGKWNAEESNQLPTVLRVCSNTITTFCQNGISHAMSKFNGNALDVKLE